MQASFQQVNNLNKAIKNIFNFSSQRREPFFNLAKKYISDSSIVLDIGAGNCAFAGFIGRNDITMIDGNSETVQKNRSRYPNYHYGQLPDLPFKDKYFNVIHCSHVIEHLPPNDLFLLLKNCDRCLQNEGYLIFSTPLMWSQFWDDLSHVRPYSPKIFEKYLCKESNENPTREKITNNYTIVELQYRYILKPVGNEIVFTRSDLMNFIFKIFMKLLNRVGFRHLDKTGYTIVLKKA
jgi:2-polyprenyl-3-methyl-5-hydroxy-6-metoxy-1,4-benzoquinol methylase